MVNKIVKQVPKAKSQEAILNGRLPVLPPTEVSRKAKTKKKLAATATTLTHNGVANLHNGSREMYEAVGSLQLKGREQVAVSVSEQFVDASVETNFRLLPRTVSREADDDRYDATSDKDYFVTRLIDMKAKAVAGKAAHQGSFSALPHEGSADRASGETDFANRAVTLRGYERTLRLIEAALMRIDEGAFGVSADSGEEISYQRLVANPLALRTVEEQERLERPQALGSYNNVISPLAKGLS